MKLTLYQEDCNVKLNTLLSLSLTKNFLYTIESNKDLEFAFEEYMTSVTYMVTIYVGRVDKYILSWRNKDGEAELEM